MENKNVLPEKLEKNGITPDAIEILSSSSAFLNDIIETVLAFEIPLDRDKIFEIGNDVYQQKSRIERQNTLVNRKVAEYYRRQKNHSVFVEEKLDTLLDLNIKYKHLLLEYDILMTKYERTIVENESVVVPLENQLSKIEMEFNQKVSKFEKELKDVALKLIESNGIIPDENALQEILNRMRNTRRIVNEERYKFIVAQNIFVESEARSKSLEDLGFGLRMVDFEQLDSEVQSLSDKIEEREKKLEEIRLRCNSDTQKLAHVREKEVLLLKLVDDKTEFLKDKEQRLQWERENLTIMKNEREILRKKSQKMSEDVGLLDKPVLLKDYDQTMAQIEEVEKKISLLSEENEFMIAECQKLDGVFLEKQILKRTHSQIFDEYLENEKKLLEEANIPFIKRGIIPYKIN